MKLNWPKDKLANFCSWFFLSFLIFIPLLLVTLEVLDPDLGWHLRIGRDLWVQGIFPRIDFYSFSFAGHAWVDHAWLVDLISYPIYKNFGYLFLAIFFSFVVLITFWLQIIIAKRIFKVNTFLIALIIMFSSIIIASYAITKTQVFSWLCLSLLLYCCLGYYYQKNVRLIYFIPLIFLAWANLHGDFPLGIVLLLLLAIFSKDKKMTMIFLISVLTTFINPYGPELWTEPLRHLTNTYAGYHITEWMPLYSFPISLAEIFYLIVLLVSFYIADKKIPLVFYIFVGLMLIAAISARKNMPFLVFSSLPFILYSLNEYTKKSSWWSKLLRQISLTAVLGVFFVAFSLVVISFFMTHKNNLNLLTTDQIKDYPAQAVKFLQANNLQGNVFNPLEWGGYLLWNMPPAYKDFYDGRMSHWTNGSQTLLKEYASIFRGENNWQEKVDQYHINVILTYSQTDYDRFFPQVDWLNNLVFKKALANPELHKNKLLGELLASPEWQEVYQDEIASIFVRK